MLAEFMESSGSKPNIQTSNEQCVEKRRAEVMTFFSKSSLPNKFEFPSEVVSIIQENDFLISSYQSENERGNDSYSIPAYESEVDLVVICGDKQSLITATRNVRRLYKTAFICVWHPDSTEDAFFRQGCFGLTTEGANMVSYDLSALLEALKLVKLTTKRTGHMQCPICQLTGFSEDELWYHNPLYHVNCINSCCAVAQCPVCHQVCDCDKDDPYPVHLRNCHGPCGRGEIEKEGHTGLFAIVVCRRPSDGKYLMVQEFANSGFWVPGGQLDAGESLRAAVVRETIEEAGVEIELKGVLDVMIQGRGRWRRITFYAEPRIEIVSETVNTKGVGTSSSSHHHLSTSLSNKNLPKTLPDFESTGACWVTMEEVNRGRSPLMKHHKRGSLNSMHVHDDSPPSAADSSLVITDKQLKLRGYEPLQWFNYVENGGEILPLEIPLSYAEMFSDVPF